MLLVLFLIVLFIGAHSFCPQMCNGHGVCGEYDKCYCFTDSQGQAQWRGADCSLRYCPMGIAWVGEVVKANDVHPLVECSNRGECQPALGTCKCFDGFEGLACEIATCPSDCNNYGICMTQQQLAEEAGRIYETPWDATKHRGCLCDVGRRGPDCSLVECPSGPDPMGGDGNESGRDCSGRGICDYSKGSCTCFLGFFGTHCQYKSTLIAVQ